MSILKKSQSFSNLNYLEKTIFHLHPNTLNHLHDAEYIKCLGKGSFGEVKLYKCMEKGECENNSTCCNEYFVVKKLKCYRNNGKFKIEHINKKFIKKNLINEYTIGTLLDHPCIRKTLDVDLVDNALIFEYFPGIDLFEYLKAGNCNINDEINFYEQFIDAVEYMHQTGIAHMDLKLENIMVDTVNKKIKIIDFGESRVFHDINHIETVIPEHGIHGSEPYIAPEEFVEDYYDPEKVDVWSCGIILYEIIYISIPWQRAEKSDYRFNNFLNCYNKSNLLKNTFFKKHIGDDILLKMLNPNPYERPHIKDVKEDILKLKYQI
jgi:serine/threonine protein kinase